MTVHLKYTPNLRALAVKLNVEGEGKNPTKLQSPRTGEAEASVFHLSAPLRPLYLLGAPALPAGGPQSE